MSRLFIFVAIVALVLVVSIVIGLRWGSQSEDDSLVVPPEAAWPDGATPPPGYGPMDAGIISENLRGALDGLEITEEQRDKLMAVATESINSYWRSDAESFEELLEARGLKADPTLLENDGSLFRSRTMAVRDAPIEHDEVTVEWQVRDGLKLSEAAGPTPGTGKASAFVATPRGPDDVIDPIAARTDVLVIAVPAFMRDYQGAQFEGEFRIFFAQRPSDGEWLPIRTEIIYPSTTGTAIVPPV